MMKLFCCINGSYYVELKDYKACKNKTLSLCYCYRGCLRVKTSFLQGLCMKCRKGLFCGAARWRDLEKRITSWCSQFEVEVE